MCACRWLDDKFPGQGLLPTRLNRNRGTFTPMKTYTVGAMADSYYEYLLKMWLFKQPQVRCAASCCSIVCYALCCAVKVVLCYAAYCGLCCAVLSFLLWTELGCALMCCVLLWCAMLGSADSIMTAVLKLWPLQAANISKHAALCYCIKHTTPYGRAVGS